MSSAEAPEVDEEAVPRVFLFIAMLERFEGEKGGAPSEGSNDVFIAIEDVKGGTHVATREESAKDFACIILSGFTV